MSENYEIRTNLKSYSSIPNKENKILLVCILNLKKFQITIQFMFDIFKKFGIVQKSIFVFIIFFF